MVLPFVMLSLLPQGVMPDRNTAGEMVLVLCSPDGPVAVTVDLATGQAHKKTASSPCHWSIAQAGLDLVPPFILALPLGSTQVTLASGTTDLWRPAYDPRGIWARGPPILI